MNERLKLVREQIANTRYAISQLNIDNNNLTIDYMQSKIQLQEFKDRASINLKKKNDIIKELNVQLEELETINISISKSQNKVG